MAQVRICDICHGNSKQHRISLAIRGMLAKQKQTYDDGYNNDGFFFSVPEKYDINVDKEICVSCMDKIQKFMVLLQKESEKVGLEFKNIFNPKGQTHDKIS